MAMLCNQCVTFAVRAQVSIKKYLVRILLLTYPFVLVKL